MDEQKVNGQEAVTSGRSMVRESLAIIFRRRRLIRSVFLWSLLGALLAVMVFGILYESDMEIILKQNRTEMAVTPDQSPRPQYQPESTTLTEQINDEVEFLTSSDVLEHVVVTCGLQYGTPGALQPYKIKLYKMIPGYEETLIPRAVEKLNSKMVVDAVKEANMISVSYTSSDPDQAACVTRALSAFYMQKHMAVMKPPQIFNFFAEQAENYRKQLYDAEARLLNFARTEDAVEAHVQMGLDVQQQSQFLASLRQIQVSIAQTTEHARALEDEISKTPLRISTLANTMDNHLLIANLNTTLVNLELQLTDQLRKYDPSYPLVQETKTQIAQARAALEMVEKSPVRSDTTAVNPTYESLVEDLAKAKTTLPGLQAQAEATSRMVKAYQNEALQFDQKNITQQDLTREVSAAQGNYLLYLTKREQARIEDMLDARRVLNVVVTKPPTVPVIPTFSPLLLIALAFVCALFLSIGAAFAVDYLDPSFRTPDEVKDFLNVPVFASIPENGHNVPAGSVLKNGI